MAMRVEREQDIINEAVGILTEHMPPDRLARLFAAWQVGSGDYTQLRQELFAGETVASLSAKIREFEKERGLTPAEG